MEEFEFTPKEEPVVQNEAEFSFTPKEEPDFSKLKADEVVSTDGTNTNASQKMNAVLNSWIGKGTKIYDAAYAIDQTRKSATRGIFEIEKNLGTLAKVAGDNLGLLERNTEKMINSGGKIGTLLKLMGGNLNAITDKGYTEGEMCRLRTVGDSINEIGDLVQKHADSVLKDKDLQLDEEITKGDFMENPSWTRAFMAMGNAMPSLLGMGVLAKISGPLSAYFVMAGVDSADVYEKAKEKDTSQTEANLRFGSSVVATAAIDKVLGPLEHFMKASPNRLSKKLAKYIFDGAIEGTAEGLQTGAQNAFQIYNAEDIQNLGAGVIESMIGGFGSGAVASSLFSEASDNLKKQGATDEEINTLLDVFGMSAQQNADKLSQVAFQEVSKGLKEFDKFIEENMGTPEAQRALKTKAELQDVYDAMYNTMIQAGRPEAEAKSISQIWQGIALFGSQETGMTPMEYLRQNSPKAKAEKYAEFKKKWEEVRNKVDNAPVNPFKLLTDKKAYDEAVKAEKAQKGKSLLAFIKSQGGVIDEGGDLKSRDAIRQYPGLINNKKGNTLDDMARMAWENGYLQGELDYSGEIGRPSINKLLEAIDDELNGVKHYAYDNKEKSVVELVDSTAQAMDELGIDYSNMSAKEAEDAYLKAADDYIRKSQNMSEDEEAQAMADYYAGKPAQNNEIDEWADIPFQESLDIARENERLDAENPAYEGETITINGQEKTVYNSNGDRIAKSKEALENFYKWFGDSKVVDEQGRPLVVYHGTSAEFSVFDITKVGESTRNKGIFGYGFYSSNKEKIASSYRRTKGDLLPEGQGYIMPLYYKLENPFMWFQGGRFKEAKESIEIAKKLGFPKERIQDDGDGFIKLLPLTKDEQIEKFTQSLKDNGYDGVIFKYSGTDLFEYVAFNPNQIKSTSNRGTYSESDNIYYQFAGEKAQTAALDDLDYAQQMEWDGQSREEILRDTGWFRGADGKWRFEISDKNATIKESGLQELNKGNSLRLEDILGHKDLYKAYPALANIEVKIDESLTGTSTGAYVNGASAEDMTIYVRRGEGEESFRKILLHEIQHDIQTIEGFARGGDTSTVSAEFLEKRNEKIQSERDAFWENKAKELLGKDAKEYLIVRKNSFVYSKKMGDAGEKLGELKREHYFENNTKKRQKLEERINKLEAKYEEYSREFYNYSEMLAGKYYETEKKIYDALKKEVNKNPQRYKILDKYMGGLEGYRRLYGEIEARNTEARSDLTGRERLERTPESTQDIANADAIVVFDDGTAMAYEPETYYQSAFAGSPVDYDTPSLEAIGSGEGNQAHGWGLYYALNRAVAEGYRKRSTESRIYFRGKQLINSDSGNPASDYWAYYTVATKGLQGAKDWYNEAIEIYENSLKEWPDNREYTLKEIKQYKEGLEKIEALTKKDIEELTKKGQVHEVDIPENPYLLDEDATYFAQPEIVRNALDEVINNLTDEQISKEFEGTVYPENRDALRRMWKTGDYDFRNEGGDIYKSLSKMLGSPKAASQMLEKYGIKGITYYGQQDGRCFVIFNPADVKVIQKFYQNAERGKGAPKGAFTPDNVIHLFEGADASTFMHETAHWFRAELKRFGTARSREMLRKVDAWENAEFDKRYKVELKDGAYVIKDQRGNLVYDRQFNTEEEARNYGRNEIFARGFEQYLRTGKAPNSYLKSAFKSFWNWLRTLYRSARQLNADINQDIEDVYGTILGGEELDFYLNETPERALQQKFADNDERAKLIDENIARAQAMATEPKMFENFVAERTESKKGKAEFLTNLIVPISTRAKRVSQGLKNRLRAYDYALPQKLNEYNSRIKPFMDKWAKFNQDDMVAFDLALKNDYVNKQLAILEKYDAVDDFEAVHDLLNLIYDEAKSVGVDIGYRENYFPREVADVDGLMSYLYGPSAVSELRRAEREAHYEDMLPEEQAEFVNKFLRGYERKDLIKSLPGNVKERRIDVVTSDMNVFYKNSMQALMTYIERMTNSIESRRFWGMDAAHIDESIGAFVDDMIARGEIKPEQDKEVENILRARFKARGVSNKFLLYQKNMAYIYTMGGINSAITQIDDISVALYKAGLWNTVQSIFAPKHKGLSREELGLTRIGEEFMEASASSKAVSAIFKATGLDKIDAFGKNVLINATFKKFQKMANSDEAKLREHLEPIMEQETDATIEAIKNDEITDNVKLLMFNELADMQPISLSEMPEYYLRSGNGRVLYMLKTFALKRIDIFRNEAFDEMRKGNVKGGVQNLFKLSLLMMLCGMGKDALIDLLFGRKIVLSDAIVNNLLGLFGFSKYQLYRARSDGFTGLLTSVAVPPILPMWSDLFKDMYKSLFTKNGEDIENWEVWKGIPIIGRFYYWWMGGGYAKEQKKKKKLK